MNQPPVEMAAIAFEIVTNTKERKLLLIVSGETSDGDRIAVTSWDYALVHEMCGRLLGGMVAIDREATLGALRSVLVAYAEDDARPDMLLDSDAAKDGDPP